MSIHLELYVRTYYHLSVDGSPKKADSVHDTQVGRERGREGGKARTRGGKEGEREREEGRRVRREGKRE